jgi:hypothetical protein
MLQDLIAIGVPDGVGVFNIHQFTKDRFAIMQYTGLKDKNDKEIYEGDIVAREKGSPWAVGHEPYGFYADVEALGRYLERGDPYEVIGNCFENPELLK